LARAVFLDDAWDHVGSGPLGGAVYAKPLSEREMREMPQPLRFETKDSGDRAQFRGGGQRDTEKGKPRFDLIFPKKVPYAEQLLTRLAELMGRGAEKYADRNWELFDDQVALDRAKSSALRHFMQWVNGETDEDHAAAVVFNLIAAEYIAGHLEGKW
jgi:hypothetical protein